MVHCVFVSHNKEAILLPPDAYLNRKMHKNVFSGGVPPRTPMEDLTAAPSSPSWISGLTEGEMEHPSKEKREETTLFQQSWNML